jgi:protein-S-isoprenylcysteine O-methyltransferase Ste14
VEWVDAVDDGGPPNRRASRRRDAHCAGSGAISAQPQPAYVGLIVLDVALALLWPSAWALLLVPLGIAALFWGAVAPEERYLTAKFGKTYDDYRSRVRRWL